MSIEINTFNCVCKPNKLVQIHFFRCKEKSKFAKKFSSRLFFSIYTIRDCKCICVENVN